MTTATGKRIGIDCADGRERATGRRALPTVVAFPGVVRLEWMMERAVIRFAGARGHRQRGGQQDEQDQVSHVLRMRHQWPAALFRTAQTDFRPVSLLARGHPTLFTRALLHPAVRSSVTITTIACAP